MVIHKGPLVSIGMPVYNGERFIQQALDSLLDQDYDNFELIISDNASTDQTPEICQEYVVKDKRVRFYRNDTNLGAITNFDRVLALSSGKYFMWAGSHDLWHPTFVSRCVSILEMDNDVCLAYSRTMLIDQNDTFLYIMSDQVDTRGMAPAQRYKYLLFNLDWCNMIYGVIRRDVLLQTGAFRNVFSPDHALLAELSLIGQFAQINEPLYYRRKNRADEDLEVWRQRVLHDLFPTTYNEHCNMSIRRLYKDLFDMHLKIIFDSPLRILTKANMAVFAFIWFLLVQYGLLKRNYLEKSAHKRR